MSHFKIQFETSSSSHGRQRVGAPKPKKSSAPAKLPHITKLMALAIRLEHLLATGQVKDQAEIARTAGITRARVTQIINLTQLAPDIQEAILNLEPTTDHVPRFREREVRTIAILPNWEKQRVLWKRLERIRGDVSELHCRRRREDSRASFQNRTCIPTDWMKSYNKA